MLPKEWLKRDRWLIIEVTEKKILKERQFMSPRSKKEYIETIVDRYKKATRKQKTLILDEFCSTLHCHRKHAIRALKNFKRFRKPKNNKRELGSELGSNLYSWIHTYSNLFSDILFWFLVNTAPTRFGLNRRRAWVKKQASRGLDHWRKLVRLMRLPTLPPLGRGKKIHAAASPTALTCRHSLKSFIACQRSYPCWSPSQRSGVVLNARESLKAMSGVIAPRSFTILEMVFRETPRIPASSVRDMDKGSKWWCFKMRPGCTGGLFLSLMIHLSMVIFVIHFESVALLENKGNTPIAGNLHGLSAFLLGLKEMESWAPEIHIPDFPGLVQAIKDFFQPSGVLGLNSFFAPIVKEILQAFVKESLNHEHIVTREVTLVKWEFLGRS
jgi:hypothetical protein